MSELTSEKLKELIAEVDADPPIWRIVDGARPYSTKGEKCAKCGNVFEMAGGLGERIKIVADIFDNELPLCRDGDCIEKYLGQHPETTLDEGYEFPYLVILLEKMQTIRKQCKREPDFYKLLSDVPDQKIPVPNNAMCAWAEIEWLWRFGWRLEEIGVLDYE